MQHADCRGCYRAARASHMFLSPDKNGQMTIYQTSGNPYGHIIMRGGKKPNYHADDIAAACDTLHEFDLPEHLVVDFSHGKLPEAAPSPVRSL